MKILMMIPGFFILSGIAVLLVRLLRVRFGEGMFLAVSVVMALLFLSGKTGTFFYGQVVLLTLGTVGLFWNLIVEIRGRDIGSAWNVPVFWILVLVLLYGMFMFWHAPLQHIDEFHLWGATVQYMEKQDRLVDWTAIGISGQFYAASLFQLFFQKLTGYSEQGMYAASFLMLWIGLLLPWSSKDRKGWKSVLLYSMILFVSFYSLYLYPYKTLYTDLPAAAWAGGLAGWWLNREEGRKKQEAAIFASGLLTLVFLKSYVGILMALIVVLLLLTERIIVDRRFDEAKFRVRTGVLAAVLLFLVVAGAGAFLLLVCKGYVPGFFPSSVKNLLSAGDPSIQKAVRVMGALGNAFFGKKLGGMSRLELYPFVFILLILILLVAQGWLTGRLRASGARMVYLMTVAVLFLVFLAASYICLFNYEEAVIVRGIKRYFSILMIYDLMIALTLWFGAGESNVGNDSETILLSRLTVRHRIVQAGALGLLLFFAWGINDKFLSSATAFNDYQISGSEDIAEANAEVRKVSKAAQGARVYFLNQRTDNEYPQNIAFYHLGRQSSNYLSDPWRFTEDGCEIRIQEYDTPKLENLPQILAEGNYQYIWLYAADEYLAENLETVFAVNAAPDQISDGQLYKVRYENGTASGLELVKQMNQNAVPVLRKSADGKTSTGDAGDETGTAGQTASERGRSSGNAAMEPAADEDADEAA